MEKLVGPKRLIFLSHQPETADGSADFCLSFLASSFFSPQLRSDAIDVQHYASLRCTTRCFDTRKYP